MKSWKEIQIYESTSDIRFYFLHFSENMPLDMVLTDMLLYSYSFILWGDIFFWNEINYSEKHIICIDWVFLILNHSRIVNVGWLAGLLNGDEYAFCHTENFTNKSTWNTKRQNTQK